MVTGSIGYLYLLEESKQLTCNITSMPRSCEVGARLFRSGVAEACSIEPLIFDLLDRIDSNVRMRTTVMDRHPTIVMQCLTFFKCKSEYQFHDSVVR